MQRNKLGMALAGFAALLVIAGGQSMRAARAAQPSLSNPTTNHSDIKRYVLTGTVQSIDVPNHQVVVDGDAVPGYMDAMSMPYNVPDEQALKALNVGDIIRANIIVDGSDVHLENIQVTGHKNLKGQ
ncbi:MAG: copper-binding protein [Candidatus Acidiferrales bacterium]